MRGPAENAELALLLEVAGTPKPGNVDRERDFPGLRFEHFLAGAVGARTGLRAAAEGAPVGESFERAVAGMAEQSGGNTQFGALLLLVPLVAAAGQGRLSPDRAAAVAEGTTIADATGFYRAFDHVDVFVSDPPADMADLDVRRGSGAIPALEERGLTLYDVMERSAPGDGDGAEWVSGFPQSFETGRRIADDDGPVPDRAARAFLALLAEEPDTLVVKQHGRDVAADVADRASELLDADRDTDGTDGTGTGWDRTAVSAFGDDLVARGVNPGTTADVVAAGLFVALERHGVVV